MHVYALAVAACILLSLVPFLIVIVSICQDLFRWKAATEAIYFALGDYFPDQIGIFIVRNLKVTVAVRHFQIISVLLLLVTANGIFVPLEVALNRIWGCPKNRSYIKNQIVSLALIIICGGLFLLSTTLTALNSEFISQLRGINQFLAKLVGAAIFKLAAIPISMLMLFLVYWLLPNCKIPARQIVPAAIGVGLLLEALKYVNVLTWPWLRAKLSLEYGPFVYSVTILLYGFAASMIVLAGAEWSARRALQQDEAVIASPS